MTTKRRTSIRDVARAADVSIATVSKFMNKLQRFSPEIEARIRHAVEELDYHQSLAARSLIAGRTRTVALAVQDVHNPYFTSVFGGASRISLANDYSVLVIDLQENPAGERALLEGLARRVDGLIVASRVPADANDWLAQLGKPVVSLGRPTGQPITSVRSDSSRGAYLLGKHLIKIGRQRIAYLGLKRDVGKFQGLSTALAESGLMPLRYDVPAPTLEGGEQAAAAVLLEGPRPDAVVCRNDLMAIGLMHAAQALGLRVPEDVAIAGYDNIPVARYMKPSLTSIDMRSEEQGAVAMQKLMAAILQTGSVEDIALEPRLILRASTGDFQEQSSMPLSPQIWKPLTVPAPSSSTDAVRKRRSY